jgi:hypothetical protein
MSIPMSILNPLLLLVFVSILLCPVASQTGQEVHEVKSGHCTSAELIGSATDCQAAADVLGLVGTVVSSKYIPPGCSWRAIGGSGYLYYNSDKASTHACGDGTNYNTFICLCLDPCPIGTYQNEESSKTCKSCLPGTYNDESGQALCKSCPEGWNAGHPGSTVCAFGRVKEVKSGHCTGAELMGTAAECQAAAKALGLDGTVNPFSGSGYSPGCIWNKNSGGGGDLYFNTNKASTAACGDGATKHGSTKFICICVEPCQIGTYQNEESSKTCKLCRPGTYNDEIGRSSCQNCTIGKYNNEMGESTCRNCPAGKNSRKGASNCRPNCCHAKANYPTYEKDCNTITDAAACSDRLHHLLYTCDWNCDVTTVVDTGMHNVSQKYRYLRD